jgi:hypothetical protein
MIAKNLCLGLLVAASANLMADDLGYRVWLDASTRGRTLTVVPHVAAPGAATLHYEIVSTKIGTSGRSNTRQSGRVTVDEDGRGTFATLSLGIAPDDHYFIAVKVFDRSKLVAQDVLNYPR